LITVEKSKPEIVRRIKNAVRGTYVHELAGNDAARKSSGYQQSILWEIRL
jgi:hypothetical protein